MSAQVAPAMRLIRSVSERDIAIELVLELADLGYGSFSLMGFYDDDREFLEEFAERLNVKLDKPFLNKLTRVVRRLVRYNILHSRMSATAKEYIDEPAKQMNYWLRPGKADLLKRGLTEHTMAPEDEAAFLLRHAYPAPEKPTAGEPKP